MLIVLDSQGNDTLAFPPAAQAMQISQGNTPITIAATVIENDPDLPLDQVSASIDWNDGTQPVVFGFRTSPLNISVTRNLSFGTYAVTLTAVNARAPVADTRTVVFPVQITQLNQVAVPPNNVFGPILPRDDGLPNKETWNFDLDSDTALLSSNLKALLTTTRGERLMLPNYGTNLRRIIFELNVAQIESLINQEISQAVALYEPRVTLSSLQVLRDPNNRLVTVLVTFLTRQNNQVVDLSLQFNK